MALNNNLAFEGYSYLLITDNYGCMCSVVLNKLDRINDCFKETKKFFKEEYDLDIKSPKKAGGIGSFALKHLLEVNHKEKEILYIGEAAGLQDFLWGFGMRFAFESGYLAARSIIEDKDYEKMARKEFNKRLKASVVNRYIWEKLGDRAYSFLIKHPIITKKALYSLHKFNILQRMIYPFAISNLKKKYPKLEL